MSVYILSGFGKGAEIVDVYRIPSFVLSDGSNKVTFHNLVTAVTNRPMMEVDFVLPWSIFSRSRITFDRLSSVVSSTASIETQADDINIFFRRVDLTEEMQKELGITSNTLVRDVYTQD